MRYSRGPRVMGQTGDNSFRALLGYLWMAVLDRVQGFRLFQAQVPGEGPWALDDPRGPDVAEWVEVPAPPLPHPHQEVRHIALCFDQAARHVVAYEYQGQVYVRQWDPVSREYVMRGPWPGVDPLVIWDFEVGYYVPDSDVVLLHLSPDRSTLVYRVQRELYATAREVPLPGPAYLDQAVALPYQFEALGSFTADPDASGVVLRSDLYPVYVGETAGSAGFAAPVAWDLIPVVVVRDLGGESAGSVGFSAPVAWDLIREAPVVVVRDLGGETAGTASFAAPVAWDLIPVVVVRDLGGETAGTASFAAPVAWDYRLVVVVYDGGADVAATAAFSAPTAWSYDPA
ncbi:hypothetical protein [Thermus thermophilus]|uniref:hypothetical protein n=1 Tax=Thermus thermophilus TaxID=274 RepID=UPI002094A8C5|nr:hypothetical protein [Thermus thermophilus]